jgi:hypothetical protein
MLNRIGAKNLSVAQLVAAVWDLDGDDDIVFGTPTHNGA